jgi:hypothetical protein
VPSGAEKKKKSNQHKIIQRRSHQYNETCSKTHLKNSTAKPYR